MVESAARLPAAQRRAEHRLPARAPTLKGHLQVARSTPLHDRQRELGAIDELIDRTHGGSGCALAMVGPPGIGRTALLEHARACAGERGFSILVARGVWHERELPFGVAHQALDRPLGDRVRGLLLANAAEDAVVLDLHAALMALAERTPTLLVKIGR